MLRVNDINKSYYKRTLRPLYDITQATPKNLFLDPAWNGAVDIVPGMAMMKTTGDNVTVLNATGVPYGLAGIFEAPSIGITEITNQGINSIPVWVLGPDAEFQLIANGTSSPFDTTLTWTDPGDGTLTLVSAYTSGAKQGQLCPAGTSGASATPIARLLRVDSTSSIVIGGLQGRVA